MTVNEALDLIRKAGKSRVGPASVYFTREFTSQGKVKKWKGVTQAPATMAAQAKLSLDEYSLARLVASECGALPAQYMLAVAEAVRDNAAAGGLSVTAKLVASRLAFAVGKYGQQAGRFAATTQDPNERHVATARIALARQTDMSMGAYRFFAPKVQDGGKQGGEELTFNSAILVLRKWYAEGDRWTGPLVDANGRRLKDEGGKLDIIDPYALMLMTRTGGVDLETARQAIIDGRRRFGRKLVLAADSKPLPAGLKEPDGATGGTLGEEGSGAGKWVLAAGAALTALVARFT